MTESAVCSPWARKETERLSEEVMSEAQVGVLKLSDDRDGETSITNMLGQDWFWRAGEEATGNARISKLRVRVYTRQPEDDDAAPLIDLDGYRYHAN